MSEPRAYRVGERVTWKSFNRETTGTVVRIDGRGALVDLDRGGQTLLTTTESYRNFLERYK